MEPYQHRPLSSARSIRVLRLEPAEHTSEEIKCRLEEVSLDEVSDFDALSYSWDAQSLSHPVLCGFKSLNADGTDSYGVLKVTYNCLAAMRQLRRPDETRTLWIDSICIDQSSIEERNQQVPLMGKLYSTARAVVIWLGESSDKVEAAMRFVVDIRRSVTRPENGDDETWQLHMRETIERMQKLRDGTSYYPLCSLGRRISNLVTPLDIKRDGSSADVLEPLFNCTWFQRMWTVQEATLPYWTRVTMHCGDTTMPWIDLFPVVQVAEGLQITDEWSTMRKAISLQRLLSFEMSLNIVGHNADPSKSPGQLPKHLTTARTVLYRTPEASLPQRPRITKLLLGTRLKRATDPKDKVFALYGIFQALGVRTFPVDYKEDVEDIFTKAAWLCIDFDKSIEILLDVASGHRLPGLPSWVPDYNDSAVELGQEGRLQELIRQNFNACGDTTADWSFPYSGGMMTAARNARLRVCVKVLDEVKQVHPSFHTAVASYSQTLADELRQLGTDTGLRDRDLHAAFEIVREWARAIKSWSQYPTGEDIWTAFQRTMSLDLDHMREAAEADKTLEKWIGILLAEEKTLAKLAATAILGDQQKKNRVEQDRPDASKFHKMMVGDEFLSLVGDEP